MVVLFFAKFLGSWNVYYCRCSQNNWRKFYMFIDLAWTWVVVSNHLVYYVRECQTCPLIQCLKPSNFFEKTNICQISRGFFKNCDLGTQLWTRNFPVKIPQLDALVQVSLLVHIGTMIFQISESPDSSLPPRTKEIIIYTAIQEFEEKLDIY